ncbi:Mur ligase family protein [Evansella sp. AB-P1]|uniref:Mur ligase family protein n=1 Tax=Evansella sp. AB-P1 TaxID=3037653 RepID=UPI00241C4029|nr:Mur ligase family protein [Evansella sp. AB-P1]MDG5788291.1 Mur ligase family protein [Evansella sp. AB-P1]
MRTSIDMSLIRSISMNVIGEAEGVKVKGISIDKGGVKKGDLFLPIDSTIFDDSLFIEDIRSKGAVASFWKKGIQLPNDIPNDFILFEVEDVEEALKKLAQLYLAEVEPTVVTVTGSFGKTITQSIISHLLNGPFNVHEIKGIQGEYTSFLLSVLHMDPHTDVLLSQVDLGSREEVGFYSELMNPNFSIITNISEQDNLSTYEEAIQSVMELEKGMKASAVLAIDGDNKDLMKKEWKTDVITCGTSDKCLFHVTSVEESGDELQFQIAGIHMPFTIRGMKKADVKYAVYAIALLVHLGLLADDISVALKDFVLDI